MKELFAPEFYTKHMLNNVKSLLDNYSHKILWVAYSGGLDSTVLLHLVKEYQNLQQNIDIRAIHINHNLSPNSQDWCHHVVATCKKLDIPLTINNILDKPQKPDSIEAWARKQRYDRFEALANNKEICVLLAHNQNDQAETFILNALRGSGLSGLSAIPQIRENEWITYIRPLLLYSREYIQNYAHKHNLQWIEDESNISTEYNRNYLRHEILPKLNLRWHKSSIQLAKTAQLCSETYSVLGQYIQQDIYNLQTSRNDFSSLDFNKLIGLETIKIKLILKYWLNKYFNIQLPYKEYEMISRELPKKGDGWQYQLTDIYCLQKYNKELSIKEITNDKTAPFRYIWNTSIDKELYIPELNQKLSINILIEFGVMLDTGGYKIFIIRSRQPQDRCIPTYRQKSQKLKIIFQELKIPSWNRNKSVIIEDIKTSEIVAVYPHFLCKPALN